MALGLAPWGVIQSAQMFGFLGHALCSQPEKGQREQGNVSEAPAAEE